MMNLQNKKKQQQQHQNPFTFPNISAYILFQTGEIYFQKSTTQKFNW